MMMQWYDQVQRDVRLASRRASSQATFTMVVIVCLALGIGGTVAAFSVLQPVLLASLPFEDPHDLVQIAAFNVNRTDPDERYWVSWYPINDLRVNGEVLEGVAAFYQQDFDVLGDGETERIAGAETLPGSFAVLGVRPLLGRTLSEDDVRLGLRTILISESLWSRRYGRDLDVLGRTITVRDRPYTIVGVLPAGIRVPNRAEIWPLHQPDDYSHSEQLSLGVFLTIGRLTDRGSSQALDRELDAMLTRIQGVEPVVYDAYGFDAMPLNEYLVGDFRRPLWALFASAFLVLLLASANVSNLLMARAQGEEWERALRTALGARRRRLAAQGIVENLMLAGIGALAGTLLAALAVRGLLAIAPVDSPAFDGVGISWPVAFAASALALVLALIMSALPTARCYASLGRLRGVRDAQDGRHERRVQTAFVVGQVALSLVLLVGAGLMTRSAVNLAALDLGFDTESLLVVRASAPASLAATIDGRADFTFEVVRRIQALPGVKASGAVSWVPFEDGDVGFNYSLEDFPPEQGGERDLARGRLIAPGYFASMDIPLASGRLFSDSDRLHASLVAIVSRAFERKHWPDGSAVGRRVKRGAFDADRPWIEIVGVVEDIRSGTLSDAIRPAVFYPHAQSEGAFLAQMAYTVRTDLDDALVVPAIRAAIGEVAPAAGLYGVTTGTEIARGALGRAKFNSLVISVFSLMGLVLAGAGVFGVTSYAVGRRTREFGLRVALGARPAQVRQLVLRNAVFVAAAGIGIGLLAALLLAGNVSDLLFEIEAVDGATYSAVAVLLAGAVFLASYVPACRATRVDPMSALRGD